MNIPETTVRNHERRRDRVPIASCCLAVEEGGAGPVFRRYEPFPGRAVAPQSDAADV